MAIITTKKKEKQTGDLAQSNDPGNLQKQVDLLKQAIDLQKQINVMKTPLKAPGTAPFTSGGNTDFSKEKLDTMQAARGNEFAPAFEANGGVAGLKKGESITGKLDYNAGQSGGGGASARAIALQKEQAKNRAIGSQQSQNTSYTYNPESLTKAKKIADAVTFALDDINNDPYTGKATKKDKRNATLESTATNLAKLFSSADEFNTAYNSSDAMKKSLDVFIKNGGSLDSITSKIKTPEETPGTTVVSDTPNLDGTRSIKYADGTMDIVSVQKNPDGSESYTPVKSTQDTATYLANITNTNPANKKAQETALNELVPERDIMQQRIMEEAQIPADLKDLYFGTEDRVGILQQKRTQAEEEKKILERKEKDDKTTLREKAHLEIEKNNAEFEITKNKIEENRLAAKNYITGYLAKLGALTTTGAAPLAIQTLDAKYLNQATEIEYKYKFANKATEINLKDDVNKVETKTDADILAIEEDLTKSEEDVAKEIMKARQSSQKEISSITERYARELRERTSKYTDDAKREAEKYAKAYAKIAAGGLDLGKIGSMVNSGDVTEGQYVVQGKKKGVIMPDGTLDTSISLTPGQKMEVDSANLRGKDTIQYFVTLPKAFRDTVIQNADGSRTISLAGLQQAYKQYQGGVSNTSLAKDASAYRERLGLQSISWGDAWNALRAKYPEAGNEEIDKLLNKDQYYTTRAKAKGKSATGREM